MMIFQINEHHGKHIAYDMNEAKRNEDNGWKTVTREEFYGIKSEEKHARTDEKDAGIKSEEKDDELVNAYIAKFGKKPHHKMKPETILEKINGHSA